MEFCPDAAKDLYRLRRDLKAGEIKFLSEYVALDDTENERTPVDKNSNARQEARTNVE
jgi:hypothetical protein